MTAPLVSVVMSVWNDEAYVGQAIDSILTQSEGRFEFLIVDDQSADASARVIAEWAARDPRIAILPAGPKGRVAALNRLIAAAKAPLIALMDSDDICRPERLAMQMAFLTEHPDHVAVSCECDKIDARGAALERPPIDRPLTHEGLVANFEDGPLLNHNAVLIRREALQAIGGYRPAYRHAEDYDLWLRLADVGKLANLPDKLVSYRIHDNQVSTANLAEQTANAAIAWLARCERLAGKPDPTAGLTALPALGHIDAVFGTGSAAYIRRRIVERCLYAPEVLAGDGWPALLGHIRETAPAPHLWRASLRLLTAGKPVHAARSALALASRTLAA